MKLGNRHESLILTYRGKPVEIDKKLAKLIQLCWDLDLRTSESCEGDDGERGYLCFFYQEHKEEFFSYMSESVRSKLKSDEYGPGDVWFFKSHIPLMEKCLQEALDAGTRKFIDRDRRTWGEYYWLCEEDGTFIREEDVRRRYYFYPKTISISGKQFSIKVLRTWGIKIDGLFIKNHLKCWGHPHPQECKLEDLGDLKDIRVEFFRGNS